VALPVARDSYYMIEGATVAGCPDRSEPQCSEEFAPYRLWKI
jgi:hypothetical protein